MAQTYPSHGVGADFHYSLLWILSAQPASSVTLDSLVNLDLDIEIIIIVTGLQSKSCYKATSEFCYQSGGKTGCHGCKMAGRFIQTAGPVSRQGNEKNSLPEISIFSPTHHQYKGELRSEADWLNWWKERGQIVDVGQKSATIHAAQKKRSRKISDWLSCGLWVSSLPGHALMHRITKYILPHHRERTYEERKNSCISR